MGIRNSITIFHEDLPQIKEHDVGGACGTHEKEEI
jgi:hypothetical protein